MIFVFGSNLAGRHGAGAARVALLHHGAVYGNGIGKEGNSYAIPTKDTRIESLPLHDIQKYVSSFIEYADRHPELDFQVTQIGCGLAGFTPEQIAPMFEAAPSNCQFDSAWERLLPGRAYWGTY
jgi:hypothetical protein